MLQDSHYSIMYKCNKLEPTDKFMLHPYVGILPLNTYWNMSEYCC